MRENVLNRKPLWVFVAALLAAIATGYVVATFEYLGFGLLVLIAGGVAGLATRRRVLAKSAGLFVSLIGFWALYKSVEMFEDGDEDRYVARSLGLVCIVIGALFIFIERGRPEGVSTRNRTQGAVIPG